VKALVWQGPELMSVDEVAEPQARPGHVIVRSQAAGICGSEIEGYLGRMSNRKPPLVMGHEFAGTVLGSGRRVAVNPIVGCGECADCQAGDRNLCPQRHLIGIGVPGGFAGQVEVPDRCLFEIPAGMDFRLGALVEPLANGVHCLRRALAGSTATSCVVIGAGTIGLACMQAALVSGLTSVVVLEKHGVRRRQALALGATEAYESGESVKPGVDLVIDAVGASATRQLAIDLVKPAGTVAFIGLHDDQTSLGWHHVNRSNIRVQGIFGYADRDFQEALDWLASGRAGIGELAPVLPLEEGPRAFAELAKGPIDQIKVFLAETV
jgi:threonine dehydrogenase-like Zn-dependent dehydrogenase